MGMNDDNRAQILRQLPAEAIASIEVMTNPSSKHSTEGTAGIINIRLKEDHRHGYFGNAEANVDTPSMYPEARHRAAVMTMERISTQTAIARSMKTACSFVWVRISDLMTRMKFT